MTDNLCPRHNKPKLPYRAIVDTLLAHGGQPGAICVECGKYLPPGAEDRWTGLTIEEAYELGRSDERLGHDG